MAVPNTQIEAHSTIGTRIHVIGNSTSGKSTLAARLAKALDATFVELDAINWQPGWVGLNATDPDELERRIREATRGERWVVAGSYTKFSQRTFWPRLDAVICEVTPKSWTPDLWVCCAAQPSR